MSATTVGVPTHELVLQLATDRQVHAFDLSDTFRVALGRHHSNDIQLRSMRVSNYHAEILNEVEGLLVRDMGSTNGTYVNDVSVRRQRLKTGDRIRIGNFAISVRLLPRNQRGVEELGRGVSRFAPGTIGNLIPIPAVDSRRSADSHAARGQLDISLPDLLNALATSSRTTIVSIRNQAELGRIYIVNGQVTHTEFGALRKEKALYRLIGITKGTYEILAFDNPDQVPQTIALPTETLVIEGMQEIEMLEKIAGQLPPLVCELKLNGDCDKPVSALASDEVGVYEAIIRHRTIVRVQEESPLTDFTIMRIIYSLLQKGYFRASQGTGSALLEETSFSRPQAS